MNDVIYTRTDPALGRFDIRPVDPAADAALLHGWLTHPKSVFWLMRDATLADLEDQYARIAAHDHHDAYLGLHEGEPKFLVERYDPAHSELAALYPVRPGDVGMHFLVAPTDDPVHGFTRAVLTTVMSLLFHDEATARVVVEPDVGNMAVHRLNAAVGFSIDATVQLSYKTAYLSTCTRAQFLAATTEDAEADLVAHLTPENWEQANRQLVCKALAEFAHERLIAPSLQPDGRYLVTSDDGDVEYLFTARLLTLDHWQIDAASIVRRRASASAHDALPLDALDLIIELRHSLALTDDVLPVYLEEIAGTLSSAAFRLARPHLAAAELARADFQTVESAMTEGHPCFIANSGRLGFDAADRLVHTPEAARPVRLTWLAARRERATFTCAADLSYDELIASELSADTLDRFAAVMAGLGLDLADYLLIPVHPWQWRDKLTVAYANEIARRDLVRLGPGDDEYRPQQSVRTFFNVTVPRRHYVKTALSVLNMGFMRGLSAEYMKNTPAINDWLADLVAADPVLQAAGFGILRERAAIGYHHPHFEAAVPPRSPYRKMLAVLWRESPVPGLRPGERLVTMAALLHVDRDGGSLVSALITDSGRSPRDWLRGYLDAYLTPILHCFYEYGLVFMPHGENVILVLDDTGVRRALFKDLAEEINVLDPETPLPPPVERIRAHGPDDLRTLAVFTDVFDCFFRFLAAILVEDEVLDEPEFWSVVADCVTAYERANPRHADRFARYDLFADRFALSCLNRLQLRDNRQMVDLQDPLAALQLAGTLANPIAPFLNRRTGEALGCIHVEDTE